MPNHKPALAGFTLLETLISFSLLALICAVLFPLLHNSVRIKSFSQKHLSTSEELQQSRKALATTFDMMIQPPRDDRHLRFDGDHQAITFLAIDSVEQQPVLVHIQPTHRTSDKTTGIVLSYRSIDDVDGDKNIFQHTTLFDTLTLVAFRYFGNIGKNANKRWQSQWLHAQPPALVSIEMLDNNNNTVTFDFRTSVNAPYFCDFDPIARECYQ